MFVLLQVTDSTEVIHKVARDLGYAHFPCQNHTFDLGTGELDKAKTDISKYVSKVCDAVKDVKKSIKEVSILLRFPDIKSRDFGMCNWTEKAHSVLRFGRLFDDL